MADRVFPTVRTYSRKKQADVSRVAVNAVAQQHTNRKVFVDSPAIGIHLTCGKQVDKTLVFNDQRVLSKESIVRPCCETGLSKSVGPTAEVVVETNSSQDWVTTVDETSSDAATDSDPSIEILRKQQVSPSHHLPSHLDLLVIGEKPQPLGNSESCFLSRCAAIDNTGEVTVPNGHGKAVQVSEDKAEKFQCTHLQEYLETTPVPRGQAIPQPLSPSKTSKFVHRNVKAHRPACSTLLFRSLDADVVDFFPSLSPVTGHSITNAATTNLDDLCLDFGKKKRNQALSSAATSTPYASKGTAIHAGKCQEFDLFNIDLSSVKASSTADTLQNEDNRDQGSLIKVDLRDFPPATDVHLSCADVLQLEVSPSIVKETPLPSEKKIRKRSSKEVGGSPSSGSDSSRKNIVQTMKQKLKPVTEKVQSCDLILLNRPNTKSFKVLQCKRSDDIKQNVPLDILMKKF